MVKHFAIAAAVGVAALFSVPAQAVITLNNGDSVPLSTILASTDHQVNIGDKTFTFTGFTSNFIAGSAVSVTAFIAANPLDGTGFDLTGGFGDSTPGDGQSSTMHLAYSVEVQAAFLAQGYRLKDIALAHNGSATGAGSLMSVVEQVSDALAQPNPVLLGTLNATVNAGGPSSMQDFRDFSPAVYNKFNVVKDVTFLAATSGGTSTASFVRQAFSQRVIPAPSSAMLLGVAGLVARRRRR